MASALRGVFVCLLFGAITCLSTLASLDESNSCAGASPLQSDDEVSLLQVVVKKHQKHQEKSSKAHHSSAATFLGSSDATQTVHSRSHKNSLAEVGMPSALVHVQNYQVTAVNRYPAVFKGLKELLHPEHVAPVPTQQPNQKSTTASNISRPLKLLSFGCSDGSECRSLRMYFPDATIHGVDIDADIVSRNNFNNTDPLTKYFNDTFSLEADGYDAVLAMSVLCRQQTKEDHLPYANYVETVSLLHQLLRPGGYLVDAGVPFDLIRISAQFQINAEALTDGLKRHVVDDKIKTGSAELCLPGAITIAKALKKDGSVQKVILYSNKFGNAGAAVLADSFKLCADLQEVNLSFNNIGDVGAVALAGSFKVCTDLKVVWLTGNKIGDDGAAALADSFKVCPDLKAVYLGANKIGDVGAVALADSFKMCPGLTQVNLYGNNIGKDGRAALKEAIKEGTELDI